MEALGDAELLALLLGAGTGGKAPAVVAAELLEAAGGLGALAKEGLTGDLAALAGLGEARRARLEAALVLGHRAAVRAALRRSGSMAGPAHVAAWARAQLGPLSHEEIWLLALDGRHGLLSARRVAQGGLSRCSTSARDILRHALRAGASAFVLVHNHPSGDPTPSAEDARMTREMARAADIIGIPLVDHVIVGGERHASLFELGLFEHS
jgi:DNA repair protein RadC